jgi:AcrR family transcriptional regulator
VSSAWPTPRRSRSRRAGVTRAALRHHFGIRADLLIAVLDHLSDEIVRLTQDLQTGLLPLEARIKVIIRRLWTVYTIPSFLGASSDGVLYQTLRRHTRDIYRVSDRIGTLPST